MGQDQMPRLVHFENKKAVTFLQPRLSTKSVSPHSQNEKRMNQKKIHTKKIKFTVGTGR